MNGGSVAEQAKIANIEQVEYHMKCKAYETAYARTYRYVIEMLERFTWVFEETPLQIAREHLDMDVNDVTLEAVQNGVTDAMWDLQASAKVENVTSVRV